MCVIKSPIKPSKIFTTNSNYSHQFADLFSKSRESIIMGAERPVGRGRAKLIERLRDKDASVAPGRKSGGEKPGVSALASSALVLILKYPKSLMGKLVGTGGSKIKELREASGAGIDLSEEGGEVVVKIRGTSSQKDKAKELVESVTSAEEESTIGFGVPAWGSLTYGVQVKEESTNSEPGNLKSYFVLL